MEVGRTAAGAGAVKTEYATPISMVPETIGRVVPFKWGGKEWFTTGRVIFWFSSPGAKDAGQIHEAEASDVNIWSEIGRVERPGPMLLSAAKEALCEDPQLRDAAIGMYAR
jgi:hypothetical protein